VLAQMIVLLYHASAAENGSAPTGLPAPVTTR
jgi:hypothetical protein